MGAPDVSVTVPVTAPCVCARSVTTHDASRIRTVRRRASERDLCLMFFSKVTCEHGQPAAAFAVNLGRWPRPTQGHLRYATVSGASLALVCSHDCGRTRGPVGTGTVPRPW